MAMERVRRFASGVLGSCAVALLVLSLALGAATARAATDGGGSVNANPCNLTACMANQPGNCGVNNASGTPCPLTNTCTVNCQTNANNVCDCF